MNNKPELLAPVGDENSLYAAVQNGCDAIYLGGKSFNARRRAENFSLKELTEAIDYAHIRGVKVYITVNTLYKDSEINNVLEFVEDLYQRGVDGVIVQDLGTAKLINETFPEIELHGSTQLTVHNLEGVRYIEKLGFKRVMLARELPLPEIKRITENTKLGVETFIHGALCICYSGQCLMSSLIGGRSGNRGQCAQPCRLPYTLVDRETEEVIHKELARKYLLSPKDINTLEILPDLIEAGISSFKIEGRMKRPEYTALTTKIYRKYIDRYFKDRNDYQVEKEDQEKLAQVFNRNGFVPGYYKGKENLNLISYERPKNWGIKVGEVIDYNFKTKECTVKLTEEVSKGDGIEIWTEKGDNPSLVLSEFERLAENKIVINIGGKINPGDEVYKTSDKELLAKLAESYEQPDTLKEIEVFGRLKAKVSEKMNFSLWDKKGNFVSSTVNFIPEEAKSQPVTEEDFKEQLNRLGNTPYKLTKLELEVDDQLFVPISKINQLRRKAVEKLTKERKTNFVSGPRKRKVKKEKLILPTAQEKVKNNLSVSVPFNLASQVIDLGVDRIYFDYRQINYDKLARLIGKTKDQNTEVFAKLPWIAREEEMKQTREVFNKLEETNIDGYLVPQLGTARLVENSNKKIAADYSLHNFNSYTVNHWEKEGYNSVTLSPELTLNEIKELARKNKIKKELVIYGHLPMMITEYCPIKGITTEFNENKDCNQKCCGRNYGLLDRKNITMPIKTDSESCRTVIYNSQPLYIVDYLSKILKVNCQNYRLDFTIEDKEKILKVIKLYKAKLDNPKLNSKEIEKLNQEMKQTNYTTGHFFRGVK